MLSIAGQRAGPIGLNFLLDTQGWPCYRLKNRNFFFSKFCPFFLKIFFHGQRRALQLVWHKTQLCSVLYTDPFHLGDFQPASRNICF